MKKLVCSIVALAFLATPAFADGYYKSNPDSYKSYDCDCGLWGGVKFLLKLPFRLVTSTGKGLYDIVVDQDLSGFEEGYNLID